MRLYGKLIADGDDWLFWPATRLDYARPDYADHALVVPRNACQAAVHARGFDTLDLSRDTARRLGLGRSPVQPDARLYSFLVPDKEQLR